ncbi:uncharacterized protein LOC132269092 [Cornus florida]|uniref:uncharacterized protein LOC132269092 n=1 Tax=Cornus florida TaxID=4283 RepID=UPI002899C9EE|nr:uncharacterized protein LOC132269092 [Cornus florida]
MEDRETIAEYMFRINDLINNMTALGKDIKDVDVCKKILRSLTSRFNPKVTILEDKDLSEVKIDELQASLTAFEMRIGVSVVHRRETALKAKEVVKETKAKSEDDLEKDEVAYLAKKFRKFRFKKKNQLLNLTCYGCGKPGHVAFKCPNSKGQSQKKNEGGNCKGRFGRKALISDWDTTLEEEKPEETQEDECLFMAILEAPQTSVQVEEDSGTEIEEILEECERLTVNKRDFVTTAIKNFKITRMYVKKSELGSAQKVKDKGSLVKTKIMWIPKKLNSVCLLVYTAFKAYNTQDKWYVDSGCSRHVTGDGSKFNSLKQFDGGNVIFKDNQRAKIVGIGTVSKSEELPEIHEVL